MLDGVLGLWLGRLIVALLALAVAAGVAMAAVGYRFEARRVRLSRYGVYWLPRILPIAWSTITGIRCEAGRWLLDTTTGEVPLPSRLGDLGPLVAEVRRRTCAEAPADTTMSRDRILAWLGLEPGYRIQLRLSPHPSQRMRRWLDRLATLSALGLAPVFLAVNPLAGAAMVVALVLGVARLIYGRPQANLAWFDDDGIEFDTARRVRLTWQQLIALRDHGDRFTLITTAGDLTILADSDAAAAVRHTAEQVLAALAQRGGWVTEAGDASLSPAERLTGEAERGLREVRQEGRGDG